MLVTAQSCKNGPSSLPPVPFCSLTSGCSTNQTTRCQQAALFPCASFFFFCLFSELAPSQWHEHAGEIGQCCWEWAFPLPWLLLQMHTEFVCYVTQTRSDANSSVQTLHSEQLNPDFWAVQFLLLERKEAWTPELSHCMCRSLVFNFTEAQTVDYNTAQI